MRRASTRASPYVRNIFNPPFPGRVIAGAARALRSRGGCASRRPRRAARAPGRGDDACRGPDARDQAGITSIDKVALVEARLELVLAHRRARRSRRSSMRRHVGRDTPTCCRHAHAARTTRRAPCPSTRAGRGRSRPCAARPSSSSRVDRRRARCCAAWRSSRVIGEGMAFRMGGAATTFMRAALERQGERARLARARARRRRRSTVVLAAEQASRAMRSVHQAFT